MVARRKRQLLPKSRAQLDDLGPLKVTCGALEIETFMEESGQWVAVVPDRPGLIAQCSTLEGVLRQVVEFDSAFFAEFSG